MENGNVEHTPAPDKAEDGMMLFAKIGTHAGWWYRGQEIHDAICGVIKEANSESGYEIFDDDNQIQVGVYHLPDGDVMWDHEGFHCGDDYELWDNLRAGIRCFAVLNADKPLYTELEWEEETHSWI